jgi:hypothetical protein
VCADPVKIKINWLSIISKALTAWLAFVTVLSTLMDLRYTTTDRQDYPELTHCVRCVILLGLLHRQDNSSQLELVS